MGFAFVMFLAVFLAIASGGLILFYREAMLERISEVINPRPKKTSLMSAIQESGFSIGGAVEHFESYLPKSQAEQSIVKQRLIRAGYRDESAIKTFYGAKVLLPLTLCAAVTLTGATHLVGPFFLYVLCLGVGFLAPDFWLGNRIKKRQGRISRGLPDVLDLLVICIEAGLSLDQATVRASE